VVAEAAALVAGGAAVLAEATGTMGRAAAAISCACADLLSRLGREVLLRFFVGDMVIAVVVVVLPDCACICKVSSTLCEFFAYIFADASNARGLFACAYQTRRDFSNVGGNYVHGPQILTPWCQPIAARCRARRLRDQRGATITL